MGRGTLGAYQHIDIAVTCLLPLSQLPLPQLKVQLLTSTGPSFILSHEHLCFPICHLIKCPVCTIIKFGQIVLFEVEQIEQQFLCDSALLAVLLSSHFML